MTQRELTDLLLPGKLFRSAFLNEPYPGFPSSKFCHFRRISSPDRNDRIERETVGTRFASLDNTIESGCTIDDVTNHYSSLTQSLPSTGRDISFTIANQLFMNESVSFTNALCKNYSMLDHFQFSFTKNYENHIKTRYNAKVSKTMKS